MNNKIQTNNQINANIDEYQLEYIQKINMEKNANLHTQLFEYECIVIHLRINWHHSESI